MKCKSCENKIVLHGCATTLCQICDMQIFTTHVPGDKICNSCSILLNYCASCGTKMGPSTLLKKKVLKMKLK